MKLQKMQVGGIALMVLLAVVGVTALVAAIRIDAAVGRRLAALDAGQKDILKQLQELRTLAQPNRQAQAAQGQPAPPALPAAPVAIAGSAIRGNAAAKLVMLEFSDFQCPFCGRYTRETLSQIERDYVQSGKLRYAFRHFPLERLHPNAFKAAQAGECALQQGKFWEMHDRLFGNQQALADADLVGHAKALGLNVAAFQSCVTSAPVTARIRKDLEDGARAGISGTPTMFLGTLDKDGQLRVLQKVVGAASYASVKATIDAVLASPELAK